MRNKLTDFGLARQLQEDKEYLTAHFGTQQYQAPELLHNLTAENNKSQKLIQTTAADIWAVGIILYESLTWKHPFIFDDDNISPLELMLRIINSNPPELPDH
ncbi:MAG: hypothetical protein EZS28_055281, partial [Streblomastix strix]